jgi:hypothetical protein
MDKLFGAIFGAIFGAAIDVWLSAIIYTKFPPPFSDDMHGWVFAAIITGFILGAISGISIANRYPEDKPAIGKWCIVISVILACLYLAWLRADTLQWSLKWALVETGLTLIWCIALFIRGIWMVSHLAINRPKHNSSSLL